MGPPASASIDRPRRALSQEDFAFRSKIHRTHVSLFERGRRDTRLPTICAIAAALHVQTGILMSSRS